MIKTKLKVFRAMRDLTQEALANELGISRQTVIAIEKGKYNPSLKLAFKIVKFFDTTIEEVFIYQESPTDEVSSGFS